MLPDPVERFGGQIVQHRTAVEQERLAQDRRDPGVDVVLDLIAPATKHVRHLLLRVVDAIFAEHAPGQRQPLETAQPVELGEATEQVGVGGQVWARGLTGPSWRVRGELAGTAADQSEPILGRPCPDRPVVFDRAQENQGDGVVDATAVPAVIGTPQR
ncbi:hypothetical protein [Actinoplanes sp. NBRC 101535]|uniref:hypothetical protein n=1 Tax=Actinoplanes sp. NBRC 101535 TaxID=3032196 RepID=UPI00255476F9|nr:hypothetical protein [Actinoplanes sp. NBRC 101535]